MLRGNQDDLVHHGYLGDVIADYEVKEAAGKVILHKSYDEGDFKSFDYGLGGDLPKVDYDSEIIIDKDSGVVTHGEMHMSFELEETA